MRDRTTTWRDGDEESPYLLMNHLADWLKQMPANERTPALLYRVADFARWCEQQPSVIDAGDDVLTILVVGFTRSYSPQSQHESYSHI